MVKNQKLNFPPKRSVQFIWVIIITGWGGLASFAGTRKLRYWQDILLMLNILHTPSLREARLKRGIHTFAFFDLNTILYFTRL